MNPSYLATPKDHKRTAGMGKKTGVLLVNLGTPDGTDYWSMRRYLREFLWDARVIEVPRVIWWVILHVFILTIRPFKSGAAYASIWDKQRNASPLRVITEDTAAKVQKKLGKDVLVRFAMRYGQPNIPTVLSEMQAAGCGRIRVLPLYPQYAAATTGTVVDEVARWLLKQRWQPSIEIIPPYYDHPAYITAIAGSVRDYIKTLKWQPEVVVASFHGLPLKYCTKGDVYYCHSHKSARLIAEALGWEFCRTVAEVEASKSKKPKLLLTFQSRFGKEVWLQPYTDYSLVDLAKAGIKNVLVVCPGFAADCVETLEEIALEGRDEFLEAGGKNYAVVPCLNDGLGGIDVIYKVLNPDT
ncbi:MAG: ferrochelatase [Proteobacteria bacterium]|nr:ferrochelatase [Pseudomonadota bacterium]